MSRARIIVLSVFIVLLATGVWAFRIPRPLLLSHPLDQAQINHLNDVLENLWNLQNGEYNLDIVTSTKERANNGDFWLIQTGAVVRMQWKANGQIFTGKNEGD